MFVLYILVHVVFEGKEERGMGWGTLVATLLNGYEKT